jgi:dTDP-3-amino-2,3,6-trideoxy-4-keto-D-glucose/dTDP-3-amino-3,4,6-trideoxy-alpha-D-glucose/dTDP-2,6-dideoxy-D-kanosamine transaminase
MIKVWDYLEEYKELKKKILKEVNQVFSNGVLIFGPKLNEFENNFSNFLGVKHGIGVGNGTDAIYIALKALNIGTNDEVITTSNTAVPTVTAIVNAGATVKFVDINEYYLINHKLIEEKITKKTKAIIAVHLYGQSCDMYAINKIAKKYNLFVIEDCAQSHGAKYRNNYTGGLSDIGCFSFYPTKILGAYGDGGFITTNNKKLYDKMMRIRFLGMERKKMSSGHWNGKYYAIEHGTNSRLDEVQAAILLVKLKYLNKWISRRRQIAEIYNEELKNLLDTPKEDKNNIHAYYIYVVSHPERDRIMKSLIKNNIHLNVSYPWPIHVMKPYKKFVCKNCDCLPVTEAKAKIIFSLPMFPYLKNQDQEKVIKNIKIILK